MPDQSKTLINRVALVTGANRGLGREIAQHFVMAGASVMACARDADELHATGAALEKYADDGQAVRWQIADVTDRDAIADLVQRTIREFGGLHILVNNAGVYGPFGAVEETDWDEWVRAIEINLFGSVIAIRAVLPHFMRQRQGKIIQLSGGGATNPLPRISAYAASKAAVVRFAETVAHECADKGIDINSIAPGALNTRLLDDVMAAGAEKVGEKFYAAALKQKEAGGVPLTHAAELAVFLASSASDGITGRLISAVWDNWSEWPNHLESLRKSDAYTLRRITGRERGHDWGDK
jgi:NAD(P)-dependent dehydrogenase (short-subunit alcohol dehydrogenase family)